MKNCPRIGDFLMLSMKPSLLCGLMLTALPTLSFGQGVKVEYAHLDGIGNVVAVSNSAGVEIESHDYLPFGEEWCGTSVCGTVKAGQSKRFTGKERDAETGLDYFGARYYRANVGRFTTPDLPLMDQHVGDPQSWNLYSYARNNPLRYTDPDGHCVAQAQALAPLCGAVAERVAPFVDKLGVQIAVLGTAIVAVLAEGGGKSAAQMDREDLNFLRSYNKNASAKADEAQGTASSGQGTDQHGNKLGGSGKPQIHQVDHPSKKAAKDAARDDGQGAPMQHPSPKRGDPHFHPTNEKGEKKKDGVHHNYPEK